MTMDLEPFDSGGADDPAGGDGVTVRAAPVTR
jgi:hypothetical protein